MDYWDCLPTTRTKFVNECPTNAYGITQSSEESSEAQILKMLRKYYKAQFSEHLTLRPKMIKPILLYHSFNKDDNHLNENTFQCINTCGNNDLAHSHIPFSDTIFSKTEEHRKHELEKTLQESDIETQKVCMGTAGSHTDSIFRDCISDSHNNKDSTFNTQQSQHVITSNLTQSLNSESHRSAFSKLRRFDNPASLSSDSVNHGQKNNDCSLINVPYNYEDSGRVYVLNHRCILHQSLEDFHNDFKPGTSAKTLVNDLPHYGSQSMLQSSHYASSVLHSDLFDWRRYLSYSRQMETCQPPIMCPGYGCFHSGIHGVTAVAFGSHIDCDQSSLPVSGYQLECGERQHSISPLCALFCTPVCRFQPEPVVPSGEKLHKCECGREFSRNEELTRHKRIHSGHRPFHCSDCGKTFGRKDHLNKHRVTHLHTSEKKVHVCVTTGCFHRYTRSDALTRHQWVAHGIRARASKWRPHV